MISEWDVAFTLVSSCGSIDLNAATGDRYILDRGACDAGADLRVPVDNIPAADGGILHDVFSSWYAAKFSCFLFVDEAPACGSDLNRMVQNLSRHLNLMKRADGRVLYTPTGYPERLLDNVRYTSRLSHSIVQDGRLGTGEGIVSALTWGVTSPFPYLVDSTEISTNVNDGATATFLNDGSADMYPVVEVYGPTSAFTITNYTTGLTLIYDSSFPGASAIPAAHYAELDFFKNTAYMDGDQANLKPGIDIINSDFFPIAADCGTTGNVIGITGAAMTVKWASAWS